MSAVLWVAVGAGLGAVLRHLAETVAQRGLEGFPWGTFTANVVGSFVAGFAVASLGPDALDDRLAWLVVVGGCGGLTTFSGFAYRVDHDLRVGRRRDAAVLTAVTVLASIAAAAGGYAIAS